MENDLLVYNFFLLGSVEWLIVDECDRLFEGGKRGFRDQLASIYQACSGPKVRRAFFSATLSNELLEWSQTALDNIISVCVGLRLVSGLMSSFASKPIYLI